jgi:hypothetical protein
MNNVTPAPEADLQQQVRILANLIIHSGAS